MHLPATVNSLFVLIYLANKADSDALQVYKCLHGYYLYTSCGMYFLSLFCKVKQNIMPFLCTRHHVLQCAWVSTLLHMNTHQ